MIAENTGKSYTENTSGPTAVNLISHLWRGSAYGYIWTDNGKRSAWQRTDQPIQIPTGRQNVYFGLHPAAYLPEDDPAYIPSVDSETGQNKPVRNEYARTQRGTVRAVNCLYGEFDAKDFDDGLEGAWRHILSLPCAFQRNCGIESSFLRERGTTFGRTCRRKIQRKYRKSPGFQSNCRKQAGPVRLLRHSVA